MHRLLPALLIHLEERCIRLEASLSGAPPELDNQVDLARAEISYVRSYVGALSSFASLSGSPLLLKRVRELSSAISVFENLLVPAIARFAPPDRLMTGILHAFLVEAGWGAGDPPVVMTDSRSYYHAWPRLALIGVPAGEERTLLRLPDLMHEVGHVLLFREEDALLGDFDARVALYTADRQADAASPQPPSFYDALAARWSGYWRDEFVCDTIAVYLSGSSYAQQHLCLAASAPSRLFHGTATHPADHARAEMIGRAMIELGHGSDAAELKAGWTALVAADGAKEPTDFRDWYPKELMNPLVEHVVSALRNLGLRADNPADADRADLARLMAEAWNTFISTPAAYPAWEATQVESHLRGVASP